MSDEEPEQVESESDLNFDKRYLVGVLKPAESYAGSKCFGLFFETNKLSEAKKEADKAFEEDKLETVVWDKEKWSADTDVVYRLVPEVKEDKDDDDTKSKQPRKRKRKVPRKH